MHPHKNIGRNMLQASRMRRWKWCLSWIFSAYTRCFQMTPQIKVEWCEVEGSVVELRHVGNNRRNHHLHLEEKGTLFPVEFPSSTEHLSMVNENGSDYMGAPYSTTHHNFYINIDFGSSHLVRAPVTSVLVVLIINLTTNKKWHCHSTKCLVQMRDPVDVDLNPRCRTQHV